jgi:hypothetical protein
MVTATGVDEGRNDVHWSNTVGAKEKLVHSDGVPSQCAEEQ